MIGDWVLQPILRADGQTERTIGFFAMRASESEPDGAISAIWFRRPSAASESWQAYAWTTPTVDAEAFVGEVEGIEPEGTIGFGGGGNAVAGLDGMMPYERGLLAGDPMLAMLDESNRAAILAYLTQAGYPAAVVPFDLLPGVQMTNEFVLDRFAGDAEYLAVHANEPVGVLAEAMRQRDIGFANLSPDNPPLDEDPNWCIDFRRVLVECSFPASLTCTEALGCWVENPISGNPATWACEYSRTYQYTQSRTVVDCRVCTDGTSTQSAPYRECRWAADKDRWVSRSLGSGFPSCSAPCGSGCANPGLYPVGSEHPTGDWTACSTGC